MATALRFDLHGNRARGPGAGPAGTAATGAGDGASETITKSRWPPGRLRIVLGDQWTTKHDRRRARDCPRRHVRAERQAAALWPNRADHLDQVRRSCAAS